MKNQLYILWSTKFNRSYTQILKSFSENYSQAIETIGRIPKNLTPEERSLFEDTQFKQQQWHRKSCRIPNLEFYEGILTRLQRIRRRIIKAINENDIESLRNQEIKIHATSFTIQHRPLAHNIRGVHELRLLYLLNEYVKKINETFQVMNIKPTPIHILIPKIHTEEGYCHSDISNTLMEELTTIPK